MTILAATPLLQLMTCQDLISSIFRNVSALNADSMILPIRMTFGMFQPDTDNVFKFHPQFF